VTNPIVATDFKRCREGEPGRRQMLEVAQADFKLGFVHVKAPQGCRKSLAEFSSLSPILLPEASATIL
jgi:hypothetical protein